MSCPDLRSLILQIVSVATRATFLILSSFFFSVFFLFLPFFVSCLLFLFIFCRWLGLIISVFAIRKDISLFLNR